MTLACCFVGQEHMPFGADEQHPDCVLLRTRVWQEVLRLYIMADVKTFYTGMARGVDFWGAEAVIKLKETGIEDISLIATYFDSGEIRGWPKEERERYHDILSRVSAVAGVPEDTGKKAGYDIRMRYMLDHATHLIAVHDGISGGRAQAAIDYARAKGMTIVTLNPDKPEILGRPEA